MTTHIFYYTGTGNSLWVAKKLAEKLGNCHLHSLSKIKDLAGLSLKKVGFVFPVYIWGVPVPVLDFIDSLQNFGPDYCFAIAVNGGQVANTLVQLKKYLKTKGVRLNSGFSVKTPSNYIPWGGPCPEEAQQKLFSQALVKLDAVADILLNDKSRPLEKGPLWQNILFSGFYLMSKNHVHEMDGKFWVNENCNSCKICEQVCPAHNISMISGKPVWNHQCHQCFACLQWCPQEAIQYGKKTPGYQRYHHPEIKLSEIIKTN
ncbi:MAG: EFR1 family ferrodoxin [Candidatus Marinimicrobia bacterium]|nr:EFR1 family ferrodoxin [Candidatus Neomarinimicrobiota bacterium]